MNNKRSNAIILAPDGAAAEDYLDHLYEAGVTTHPIGIGGPGVISVTFDLEDETIADIERIIDAVKAVIPGTEISCGQETIDVLRDSDSRRRPAGFIADNDGSD